MKAFLQSVLMMSVLSAAITLVSGSGCSQAKKEKEAEPGTKQSSLTAPQTPRAARTISKKEEPPKPTSPTCLEATFTRNAQPGENLSNQRNLLRLATLPADGVIQPNSLCVRINGVPSKYRPLFLKGKTGTPKQLRGLVLDPITHPQAKILVQFCIGKNRCPQKCMIPRDEFMDAIGGGRDDETKNSARWSEESEKDGTNDTDVIAAIDGQLQRELEAGNDYELNDHWVRGNEKPTCMGRELSNTKVTRNIASHQQGE